MPHRILLVEDDAEIVEMLAGYLKKEGYAVVSADNGEEGVARFRSEPFDLLVVDIMMPKLDGIEVIKIVRETSSVPILIMSAKDNDIDKAIGLGFGADDYISKPFSLIEITARIKAAIRRATLYARREPEEKQDDIVNLDGLTVDLDNYVVRRGGEDIKLTAKEAEILKLFLKNPNRVFTKAQIYGFIWNDDYLGDENVINVHIRRLREKIEEDPSDPKYLKTLWGIGYKWDGRE
ncbi:DNA-binding response OmpR family regulator [Fontibacillus phaseoli]|uniref:DNA-binding response OmpR family regulator n=1 Tax=Fontibacillus phaseoli TaxID=1416533 RepID=A0A369B9M6_9BACL|nr:response regulator transcription factor [Fontibacillus phaseoli]RCX18239.1 DNA-binding response OmpR family regulator [Fontibacillus phaseoli]